jgi:citrate lyase subunit beta/citryl-CoA lyase
MARKSLERQAEMGPVFDATLDGEDGAPVEARRGACGADGELVMGTGNRFGRVGVWWQRLHAPAIRDNAEGVRRRRRRAYGGHADDASGRRGVARRIPLRTLIDTHGGLREAAACATWRPSRRTAALPWWHPADGQPLLLLH